MVWASSVMRAFLLFIPTHALTVISMWQMWRLVSVLCILRITRQTVGTSEKIASAAKWLVNGLPHVAEQDGPGARNRTAFRSATCPAGRCRHRHRGWVLIDCP